IVICTMTALAVLVSGKAVGFYGKSAGTDLTISAFSTTFGGKLAAVIIATCIAMFAFSTVLSWALYGTRCAEFLFKTTKVIKPYQVLFIIFIVVGATMKLSVAWTVADTLNAMMAVPNLIAVLALSPEVIRLMKDFFSGHPKCTTDNLQSWAQEEGGIQNVSTKERAAE
ncbi:MAG: alanine:cation symporter family protein, partial [Eubacterium sp.]